MRPRIQSVHPEYSFSFLSKSSIENDRHIFDKVHNCLLSSKFTFIFESKQPHAHVASHAIE